MGLLTADGNIGKNYQVSISLKRSDEGLLKEINQKLLNNSGSLCYDNRKNKETTQLRFFGKQICQNLQKFFIVPNKTKKLEYIYIFNNPILMKHYIRGLYDGDGVCAKQQNYMRMGFCGYNYTFVSSFQDFLAKTIYIKKNKMFNTGSCWQCSWGAKADLEKIYHYLYDESTIFLKRKKDKIYNYLYGNTEINV